ncbi:MAG: zinc-ribbon domain containing protein [Candidatus Accumulibacter sp.]|nr:zinc-ribbon domain containing protein [Accumulibacter sp.]
MRAPGKRSGKQRRVAILSARRQRKSRRLARAALENQRLAPVGSVPVAPQQLLADAGHDAPEFVRRGYYLDLAFRCVDCGAEGIWLAARQKWWYEVAGGHPFSTARRCAACRARERQRKALARQGGRQSCTISITANAAEKENHDEPMG